MASSRSGDGAPSTISLVNGKRIAVNVPLSAIDVGAGALTVTLSNDAGVSVENHLALDVRPASMPVTTLRTVDIAAGKTLTVDKELLADSRVGDATVSVGVSPVAAFDVPSLLMSLDRYPYGCAEQTTSRALPLLYVNELSAAAGLAGRSGPAQARAGRDLPRRLLPVLQRQLRPVGARQRAICGSTPM